MFPPTNNDDGNSRREFMKAAVAIGGISALSACMERADEPDIPRGVEDLSTLPQRQHAWNDFVPRDEAGNTVLPSHQVLLYANLKHDGPATDNDRETMRDALETLDRAYKRNHEGILYSVAYTPEYFNRYDQSLPEDLDLPPTKALSDFEDPDFDRQDILIHMGTDNANALLEAEEALKGNVDAANGVSVEATLTDVIEIADRRTGFFGMGMPADRQGEVDGIPDDGPVPDESPLFMGFKAGFTGNQATEDAVTLSSGPFQGGTTKHVSNVRQRLGDWYNEQSFDEQVAEMFSPEHADKEWVEGVGDNLGDNSRVDEVLGNIKEQARESGRVGHAQKAARANRNEDGEPLLLRRHFESTDNADASLHFPSLQTGISQFENVRQVMNGEDITEETPAVRERVNNGILEYIFTISRGNFLVPPRRHRVLPTPQPE